LTIAAKLAGPELLLQTLRNAPASLKAGLKTISETMDRYAQACFDAGADGFFFATQMAVGTLLSPDEYQEFGAAYDLPLLKKFSSRSSFSLLHIHGEKILFRELSAYPVQAVNWHDRKTWPTLAQGQEIFSGAVAGGLEEWGILLRGPASAIREQIQDAVAQTRGRRLIITPGCVLPIAVPEESLFEVSRALESLKG
jgi:uroporphyrinogen decarboxylase